MPRKTNKTVQESLKLGKSNNQIKEQIMLINNRQLTIFHMHLILQDSEENLYSLEKKNGKPKKSKHKKNKPSTESRIN